MRKTTCFGHSWPSSGFIKTLKIVYYINHMTECWRGDLNIKTFSNYSCHISGVWVNCWLVRNISLGSKGSHAVLCGMSSEDWPNWMSIHIPIGVRLVEQTVHGLGGFSLACVEVPPYRRLSQSSIQLVCVPWVLCCVFSFVMCSVYCFQWYTSHKTDNQNDSSLRLVTSTSFIRPTNTVLSYYVVMGNIPY